MQKGMIQALSRHVISFIKIIKNLTRPIFIIFLFSINSFERKQIYSVFSFFSFLKKEAMHLVIEAKKPK
jgi:hypothetical protein